MGLWGWGELMTTDGASRTPTSPAGELFRKLSGFGGLHVGLTVLNSIFALAMLMVLSRALPPGRYPEVVFLTAVAIYVQVIDQALGRSNFVALREGWLRGERGPRPDVAAGLFGQVGVLAAVALLAPLALPMTDAREYAENALFLGFALSAGYWSFTLQSTAWAIDAALGFVRLGLAQRAAHFAALVVLWATRDFLLFAILMLAVSLACGALGLRLLLKEHPGLRLGGAADGDWSGQLARFRTSLLSTVSELALFNSPYAVLLALFGVGPAMVAFDSILKLGRLVLMGARTLAEVALPRHSRLMAGGDRRGASRLALTVLGLCLAGASAPAAALLARSDLVFDLLLGPNNVVPANAGPAAAAILIAMALYQPAMFLLGYADARAEVRRFTVFAIAGVAAFAGAVSLLRLGPVATLWTYGVYLAIGAGLALVLAAAKMRSVR